MRRKNNTRLIDNFIARYRKEYDFFDQTARLIAQILEERLIEAGIRSIVTSRAKSLRSLEPKVRERAKSKKYTSEDDIFNDIVDLAGVRVAVYFPGEQKQVGSIIQSLFLLHGTPRQFPRKSKKSKYDKRFSGYWATHYRVQLIEADLTDAQKRYAEAKIEIQVASVLMHAWSEVEHDLVYKPQQGELSDQEYAILDELNGLVLAGEIALELLQKAGKLRVAAGDRMFRNHYDLASHLFDAFESKVERPLEETALGRIDLLYDLLKQLNIGSPDKLKSYLQSFSSNLEKRPLAEQIIDKLLTEDPKRYAMYENIRASRSMNSNYLGNLLPELKPGAQKELDLFLREWSAFEMETSEIAERLHVQRNYLSSTFLSRLGTLSDTLLKDFEGIRRMRNEVVHGLSKPSSDKLRHARIRIREIMEALRRL